MRAAVTPHAGTWRRPDGSSTLVAAIIIAAVIFIGANVLRDMRPVRVDTAAGSFFNCRVLTVVDGDGPITCAEIDQDNQPVQVRLHGIEARELNGTCHHTGICPAASAEESRAELARLAGGRVRCKSFGPSSFGRIGASCVTAGGEDLSCAMVKSGLAVRWPEYDPDGSLLPCLPRRR